MADRLSSERNVPQRARLLADAPAGCLTRRTKSREAAAPSRRHRGGAGDAIRSESVLSGADGLALAGCAAALGLIVVAIVAGRLPPFLAIVLGAGAFVGIDGMAIEESVKAFTSGAGTIFGDVGLVIALGAMLGALMTTSGAADRVVQAMLGRVGDRAMPWAIAGCAMLVGLPLFFEVGLVVMLPIILSLSRQSGRPVMALALPALAGMTVLHALLPPHPGPLIGVSVLHADLGLTMLLGGVVAVPAVALAGPLYARFVAPRIGAVTPPEAAASSVHAPAAGTGDAVPALWASLTILLLPVVLMLGRTLARLGLAQDSAAAGVLEAVGEPVLAMVITVIAAVVLLFWARRRGGVRLGETMEHALVPIAGLLMTIGAGGGLKGVLLAGGLAGVIGRLAAQAAVPPVLLAWGIAVCLRQAIGSATVATVTTAGLIAPLVLHPAHPDPQEALHASLLVLAIGAGSVFFCHVNDAGFWMVRGFFGLDLRQTVLSWSVLQTIVSVVGLAGAWLIWIAV